MLNISITYYAAGIETESSRHGCSAMLSNPPCSSAYRQTRACTDIHNAAFQYTSDKLKLHALYAY